MNGWVEFAANRIVLWTDKASRSQITLDDLTLDTSTYYNIAAPSTPLTEEDLTHLSNRATDEHSVYLLRVLPAGVLLNTVVPATAEIRSQTNVDTSIFYANNSFFVRVRPHPGHWVSIKQEDQFFPDHIFVTENAVPLFEVDNDTSVDVQTTSRVEFLVMQTGLVGFLVINQLFLIVTAFPETSLFLRFLVGTLYVAFLACLVAFYALESQWYLYAALGSFFLAILLQSVGMRARREDDKRQKKKRKKKKRKKATSS